MAGALLQLVAYGAQDVYLTANPTVTFWKAVYTRHTNFAIESMSQTLSGIANFGNKIVCRISRNGDLIGRTYVQVTLPNLANYDNYYMNRIGFCLLKQVELRIGGQIIDTHYSTWMHIWTELTHDVDLKSLLDKLVGLKNNDGVSADQANPGTLYIPLLFSYCRNPGLALPLISLQYHEVELWIDFENLNNCIHDNNIDNTVPSTVSLSNVNVWIDYIFLDTEERKEFAQKPHEYLIEITQAQDSSVSATGRSSTRLNFNHPTKFISWVLRDTTTTAACKLFTQIIAWGYGGIALQQNGSLWTWGYNNRGQLGNGTNIDSNIPNQVGTETDWVSVAGGSYNTFAIKSNGTLWATGLNGDGQLGVGDNINRNVFTQVGTATNWSILSASGYHTFGIKTDGTLWSWGYNGSGQLGLNNTTSYNTPQQVGTATNWADVITNFDDDGGFTFAIKNDRTLWATGGNWDGELGLGDLIDRDEFTQVGTATWSKISAGSYHTTGIQTNGTLWSWGWNSNGQLGLGNTTDYDTPQQIGSATNWTIINNGYDHSAAINSLGKLYTWGANYDAQLVNGDENGADVLVPTQIGTDTDWINVQTGLYHTFAIKNTNILYVGGFNAEGELGLGYDDINNKPTAFKPAGTLFDNLQPSKFLSDAGVPLAIQQFTMAIKSDGTLWGWGENFYKQLGLGAGANNKYLTPQQVGVATWLAVATGTSHTAAIKSNGTLWGVGYNAQGQLGQGNTTNQTSLIQIGVATNWTKVACGCINTAAVNSLGELWICGYNTDGQCAQGTGFGGGPETSLVQESTLSTDWADVVCGGYHIIGIKNDGSIYAWGFNGYGQIGDGTTNNIDTPTLINSDSWTKISAGIHHTLGLKNNTLYSWGRNNNGQLGNSNNTNEYTPTIMSSDEWIDISTSNYTSLGIKPDNTLWGWGLNTAGQIGIEGNTTNSNFPLKVNEDNIWTNVFAGSYHSYGLQNNNNTTLLAWGSYSYMGFYTGEVYTLTEQPCVETNTNYFTSFSSYNINTSTLVSAKLRINGQDRFAERNSTYFNYIQPYQHFNIKPDIGINVYSFALKPAEHQPSGTCNFSRIDNANLEITPTINPENTNNTPLRLSIYAFSYNVLRVASGMGGLAFSN